MQVTITLTSPIIREENMREGGWKAIKYSTVLFFKNFLKFIYSFLRWHIALEGNMLALQMNLIDWTYLATSSA